MTERKRKIIGRIFPRAEDKLIKELCTLSNDFFVKKKTVRKEKNKFKRQIVKWISQFVEDLRISKVY